MPPPGPVLPTTHVPPAAHVTGVTEFDAADATTITQSGGLISEWRDKSSNAYSVFQPNASYRPNYTTNLLNGLPGVQLFSLLLLFKEI